MHPRWANAWKIGRSSADNLLGSVQSTIVASEIQRVASEVLETHWLYTNQI